MKDKKNSNNKFYIFAGIAVAAFVLVILLAVFGLSGAVKDFADITISKTPDAILASSGVMEDTDTLLSVVYYDQKADECIDLYDLNLRKSLAARQFEWTSCGYDRKEIEQGLVNYYLSEDYLPVWVGGDLTSNKSGKDLTRWFSSVEGKSKNYVGTLKLNYRASGAEFSYENEEFYPIDEAKFSLDDKVNSDGHNHLFTMSFAIPFTTLMSGNEEFTITADDDTFVFVGNELAIDLGGIHEAATGRIKINENGEIYTSILDEELAYSGINLKGEPSSILRIFHADRDAADSIFKMKFSGMNLDVVETKIAGADNGVQVAYDPNDPAYVAPLGESIEILPDKTRGYIVLATIEGALIAVFSIFLAIAIRTIVKKQVEKE